jgi:hypothetical protein
MIDKQMTEWLLLLKDNGAVELRERVGGVQTVL